MKFWILYIFLLISVTLCAQEVKNDSISSSEITVVQGFENTDTINYLEAKNPMRAALYSAILPGAGQIYNGKWWKAPLVWGILGTGVGFIVYYNNQYREFRGYYLDKLYGNEIPIPAINNLTKEQLANIQDTRKRTRDYAIALTALGYLLNVLDATVDAHLFGINKDPDLSMKPVILQHHQSNEMAMGIGLNLKF
ncbi:MAG: DUF5683 domain-containing protein [Weeksellaceae bacterium]